MQVRDMKKNTAYATCNGVYIMPVEDDDGEIHGKWYYLQKRGEKQARLVNGKNEGKITKDPWGGCHSNHDTKIPEGRRSKPGVLADRYKVDGKGRPVGDPTRTIVQASDIAGTWKEYLVLYGDVVARRAQDRLDEERREEAIRLLTEHVRETYGVNGHEVSFSESGSRYNRSGEKVTAHIRIEFPVDGRIKKGSRYERAAKTAGVME